MTGTGKLGELSTICQDGTASVANKEILLRRSVSLFCWMSGIEVGCLCLFLLLCCFHLLLVIFVSYDTFGFVSLFLMHENDNLNK